VTLSLLFRTRYAGRRLAVRLSATTVEMLDAGRIVARHERAAGRYVEVLTLDHYLEVFKTKPGALPGATASRAYTPRTSPARDFVTIR
jgi:Mu transposase, C-terminal domain